jgi:hypothetical protein
MTLLAGCGRSTPPAAEFNVLMDAKPIPLVVTQALAVSTRLSEGLSTQSLTSTYIQTIRANDLKGYPFMDITLTTPERVTDLWTYARQLTGEEWKGDGYDSPYSVTLTGATDARDTFVSANVGLDLIRKIVATIDAMGGPSKLKEVVALEAEVFVLRDVRGKLWNIDTQKRLTDEEVQYATDAYNEMVAAHNSPQVAQAMRTTWNDFIHTERLTVDNSPVNWKAISSEDGSLDLERFAKLITTRFQPSTVLPDTRGCAGFCVVNNGRIPVSRQAHKGGGAQVPWYFGRSENWQMPWCGATTSVASTDAIGCGPSAFIGLIWSKWVDGTQVMGRLYTGPKSFTERELGYKYDYFHGGNKTASIAYHMTAPNGLRGRPLIANFMGTCWVGGGAITTAGGFVGGARGFLQQYATQLVLKENHSPAAANVLTAPTKAKMLIQEIGRDNNPVLALYFPGVGKGHYSPVTEYKIYNGLTIGVNVKTMDHSDSFYSLSASWGVQRGVFYLEKK